MLLTSADLEAIQRHCKRHRPLVEQSARAGCLHCGASFPTSEIRDWIEERGAAGGQEGGETAKCPRCGMESVLPSAAPVMLSEQMLAALRTFWFKDVH